MFAQVVMVIRAMSKEVVERTIAVLREIRARETEARKPLTEEEKNSICHAHGVALKNYYRDLGHLREIVSFWGSTIDTVSGLIEKPPKQERGKKVLQTKMARAEKGYCYGRSIFGLDYRAGTYFPNQDFEKSQEILRGLAAGKGPSEFAWKYGLSIQQIKTIRKNIDKYMAQYKFMGVAHSGSWKPAITPEEANEIRRRTPGRLSRCLFGYEWLDGKRVLKPGAKEIYEKMFQLRKEEKTYAEIADKLNCTYRKEGTGYTPIIITGELDPMYRLSFSVGTLQTLMKNSKMTGKVKVHGKLVDSGYEPAISMAVWEEAQTKRGPSIQEKRADEAKTLRAKMLACLPAFRWELEEKLKVSGSIVDRNMKRAKSDFLITERDGLLQRSEVPFPEKTILATDRVESEKRMKVLAILLAEGEMATWMLGKFTGGNRGTFRGVLARMNREGLLKRVPPGKYGKWSIRDEYVELVRSTLDRYNVTVEPSSYKRRLLEVIRKKQGRPAEILQILLKHEGPCREIAREANISINTVRTCLRRLKNAGVVEKEPMGRIRGKWHIKSDWAQPVQEFLKASAKT